MTLNERIAELEAKINELQAALTDLLGTTEQKYKVPTSVVGGLTNRPSHSVDIATGRGADLGGSIIWNNSELVLPPTNAEPAQPTEGFNKHSHSRYAGGALIKDCVEVVEYEWGSIVNKACQQFWQETPRIKKEVNTNKQSVEKIGVLDLIFNADTSKWGCPAYEIDVKKCYLVERDSEGKIALDSKGVEKKSALYNEEATKSAIVWDESAGVWRFYAIYAPGE